MPVTIAGVPCLDPLELRRSCLRMDPPLPLDPWWGHANSFRYRLGMEPGRGLLIVPRRTIEERVSRNGSNDLIFHDGRNELKFKVWIKSYFCPSPGAVEDRNMPYVVEVMDRRFLLHATPIDKGYNMKKSPSKYWPDTTDSGTAYTWKQIIEDLWSLGSLGGTIAWPAGTQNTAKPDNLGFWGMTIAEALSYALARVGCVLRFDPLGDLLSVVRMGNEDKPAEDALAEMKSRGWTVWDDYAGRNKEAATPATLRIHFPWAPRRGQGKSPWYYVEKTDGSPEVTGAGGTLNLYDRTFEAQYAEGIDTPANASLLATRADEIALDFFDKNKRYLDPLLRVFGLLAKDKATAQRIHGSRVSAISVGDVGGGVRIEVQRGPDHDGPLNSENSTSLKVVTRICPEYKTFRLVEVIDGVPQEPADFEIPVNFIMERRRIAVFGTVGTPECKDVDDLCCDPDDNDDDSDPDPIPCGECTNYSEPCYSIVFDFEPGPAGDGPGLPMLLGVNQLCDGSGDPGDGLPYTHSAGSGPGAVSFNYFLTMCVGQDLIDEANASGDCEWTAEDFATRRFWTVSNNGAGYVTTEWTLEAESCDPLLLVFTSELGTAYITNNCEE